MTPTVRYAFEPAVRDWAERVSAGFCGAPTAFFVGLREDGSPRRIYFAAPGVPFDAAQKTSLADAHSRWLLYLPHDDGTYLEWLGVDASLAARWLGRALDPDDLRELDGAGAREEWPDAWRVLLPPRSSGR
ncbi:MAG: hypothetical protein H6738_14175 [Alphaproteobacteria bacterium]|nr:hypothetical protein [Alphaproteobacteria bacterium]MCB9697922.1 hypothetical protein [Alphaproteobacteria bacterium]